MMDCNHQQHQLRNERTAPQQVAGRTGYQHNIFLNGNAADVLHQTPPVDIPQTTDVAENGQQLLGNLLHHLEWQQLASGPVAETRLPCGAVSLLLERAVGQLKDQHTLLWPSANSRQVRIAAVSAIAPSSWMQWLLPSLRLASMRRNCRQLPCAADDVLASFF